MTRQYNYSCRFITGMRVDTFKECVLLAEFFCVIGVCCRKGILEQRSLTFPALWTGGVRGRGNGSTQAVDHILAHAAPLTHLPLRQMEFPAWAPLLAQMELPARVPAAHANGTVRAHPPLACHGFEWAMAWGLGTPALESNQPCYGVAWICVAPKQYCMNTVLWEPKQDLANGYSNARHFLTSPCKMIATEKWLSIIISWLSTAHWGNSFMTVSCGFILPKLLVTPSAGMFSIVVYYFTDD